MFLGLGLLFALYTYCFVWRIMKTLVNGACSHLFPEAVLFDPLHALLFYSLMNRREIRILLAITGHLSLIVSLSRAR